jgi:hypothetical protein
MPRIAKNQKRFITFSITVIEFVLASLVVLGTAWYLFISIDTIFAVAFSPEFFTEFITILLTAIIGIEVARVLITHNLIGILEILGFVLARKALAPDIVGLDILIILVAFGVLVYVRQLLLTEDSHTI